ncbi:hypothetical protein SDC9_78914 [bioreactor metagenome]|uniref:Uncharacterized protein n=1 Tax=bioreactor metagenome TaxID=1076179 RepID=A0A644YV45_9ZZZZ
MALNLSVAAMMIGQHQSLIAYDFCCTAASEQHYSVFHAAVIDRINIFGSEFKSHRLHFLFIERFKKDRQPHAFVRKHAERHADKQNKRKK